jgi:hypothetical protein
MFRLAPRLRFARLPWWFALSPLRKAEPDDPVLPDEAALQAAIAEAEDIARAFERCREIRDRASVRHELRTAARVAFREARPRPRARMGSCRRRPLHPVSPQVRRMTPPPPGLVAVRAAILAARR